MQMSHDSTGRQGRQPTTSYRPVNSGPLPLVANIVKELTIFSICSTECSLKLVTTHACWVFLAAILIQFAAISRTTFAAGPAPCKIVAHRGASSDRPENTLLALQGAIELGASAVEIDVRTSKDGVLFLLHDPTLDRTTNGHGTASKRTMAQLKQLDAGAWFGPEYAGARIATLREALQCCRGRIDVLLDLKEAGEDYAKAVAAEVEHSGSPSQTIFGVHSVEQADRFRRLLPAVRQLGFIGAPDQVESFAKAGVDIIRIWPKWLSDPALAHGLLERRFQLQLNGKLGTPQELLPLLQYGPEWLLVDDVATSLATLRAHARHAASFQQLLQIAQPVGATPVVPSVAEQETRSFLNRDYAMQELPEPLLGMARYVFDGGNGSSVALQFHKPAVVFAVFEYNDSGNWSFADRQSPKNYGWRALGKATYRGTSNGEVKGKPHRVPVYFGQFKAGQKLRNLPPWWICLGIAELDVARQVPGFREGVSNPRGAPPTFSYESWATRQRPLAAPAFTSMDQFANWQEQQREQFVRRLVFRYSQPSTVKPIGTPIDRPLFMQQEYHVSENQKRLFRFFRLVPKSASDKPLPTIVCFMGHGKVLQVLEDRNSYQHACAARFAEEGYLVYVMENVGMEPQRDTHLEIDRLLRLDGYGWYSLLFAHQRIVLQQVFADPQVDTNRVGVAGVSTGGLLALSAAAIEPRIAAASVQGIFGSMRVSFVQDRNRHCRCGAIAGLLPLFDLPELALLVAPRPLHISNAEQDGFSPQESKRCIKLVDPWFKATGGTTPVFSQPPGGHEFAIEPAIRFFHKTLGEEGGAD